MFQKITKRKAYPVEIEGETLHVCEPTIGQIERVRKLGGEQSTGLALALCVVSESGVPLFEIIDGESDEDLANRVLVEAKDVTLSAIKALSDAILKLSNPVKPDTVEKN